MGPPLSQILKAVARKSTQCTMENTGGPSIVQSTGKKTLGVKKPAFKKNPLKTTLDLSVIIFVGNSDISLECLKKMEEFLDKECISRLCSIERGGALMRLHLQMVCCIVAALAAVVTKQIQIYLGWDNAGVAPVGHLVLSKTLRNTDLHTFIGMLGYCIKDKGEDHFDCVQRNVTAKQLEEGVEEYIKHGTPFAKNQVVLTHKNLIERAATFCRFKLKKQLGSTLPGTLLSMLQSGQYFPSASWVLPVRQGGMEYTRAAALWKCMIQLDTITMDDITQIFFEYTNPSSRLVDLGRQRLAAVLDEAREGTPHDYVVLDSVIGDSRQDLDNVIVLKDTREAALSPPNVGDANVEVDDVMFLPVVFRDRDDLNSFIV